MINLLFICIISFFLYSYIGPVIYDAEHFECLLDNVQNFHRSKSPVVVFKFYSSPRVHTGQEDRDDYNYLRLMMSLCACINYYKSEIRPFLIKPCSKGVS